MIGSKQKNPCSGKEQGFYKRIDKIEKRVRICNGIALFLVLSYTLLKDTSFYDNPSVMAALDFMQGLAVGLLLICLLYATRYGAKIRAFKHRLMKKQGS